LGDTGAIDKDQAPEQGCVRRKRRRPLENFRKRKVRVIDEGDPVLQGL
jgi:hypothetical protein